MSDNVNFEKSFNLDDDSTIGVIYNPNSYFDNDLCFGDFKVKHHDLIAELNSIRETVETENKKYLDMTIDRWIADIESLPEDEKQSFKEMDVWMFLTMVFVCDGFSENGFIKSEIIRTYLNFNKYVKENGVVERDKKK